MPLAEFVNVIEKYHKGENALKTYIHRETNSLKRHLEKLDPENLMALIQILPEHLRSSVLELTKPESCGKVLWKMESADRTRHVNEFSRHYQEEVMDTYNQHEVNQIKSELCIWNDMEGVAKVVGHMTKISNKGKPGTDEAESDDSSMALSRDEQASDTSSDSERGESDESEDGDTGENESNESSEGDSSDTYVDSGDERSD
jgi:hypothetical protein